MSTIDSRNNKDMLDGNELHFLLVDANVIFLDSWNHVDKGSYGKIFKCHIFGIESIPRHEIYVCKIFEFFDEGNTTKSRNNKQLVVHFFIQ
jgi:hypothetical protein